MSKTSISKILKSVRSGASKHSPEILTGIGIAGMIATTVLAVKATPKALELMEERREELYPLDENLSLPATEVIKACWKPYIPAAVTGVTSIACLIGASTVNYKRNAALAAAYTLSDTALREYREKVVETIGEKKEKDVRDAVAKKKVEQNPVSKNEVIVTDNGATLCYDYNMGRYFKSDIDKLKKAENEINSRMIDEGNACLNDFYYEIGLDSAGVGNRVGWSYNRDRQVRLDLSSQLADDGTPCIVLDFKVAPYYGYDKY